MTLIGIAGAARSGKDTLAKALQHALKGAELMSFAWAVKQRADPICREKYGISAFTEDSEHKKVIRPTLIDIGHGERQKYPDVWVNIIHKRIEVELPEKNIIVTDIRYKNESEMVRANGGTVIFVQREGQADIPTEKESLPGVVWDVKLDIGRFNLPDFLKLLIPGFR